MSPPSLLVLSRITKRFGDIVALDDISTRFRAGTVHGVLGENGAGKTTLMRVAAGLIRPDAGSIAVNDRSIPAGSPRAAGRAGIGMVHQHFMLVPTLSVAENCLIGRRGQGWFLSRRGAARTISEIGRRVGLEIDPWARVESLSVGQQQRVEIIRALVQTNSTRGARTDGGRVLILDEPTAVLTPPEVDQLFDAIGRLRREGMAIVFISHKLAEVERICDELTILRRGRCVYQGPAESLTRHQMAEQMIGPAEPNQIQTPRGRDGQEEENGCVSEPRPLTLSVPGACGGAGHPVSERALLEVDQVSARDPASRRGLREVCFELRAGEILGVAGVEGNGQDVLAAVIAGTLPPRSGRIRLDGHDVSRASVRQRAAAGLAHIAEDRLRQALVPTMSLAENLVLKSYASRRFARAGLMRWGAVQAYAAERLARFDVRGGWPSTEARRLSGGNQQKVVLARELDGSPRIILAHNPVRGLDVVSTRFVFEQLLVQRAAGAGVLLIHSDLDELLAVADRVAVLFGGRLTLTNWPSCDRAAIGRMMLGGQP